MTKLKVGMFALLAAATAFWTALRDEAISQTDEPLTQIKLEQTAFVVKSWRTDGSHLIAVKGKLTFDGQPVANVLLNTGTNGRSIRTREDGSFELLVDRSLLVNRSVHATSVHDAKIAGKPVRKQEADQILSASSAIRVYHPIHVIKTERSDSDANRINVHARISSDPDDKVSFFRIDKYRIAGQVEDAEGKPVKDAIVWIDRDRGEGFAKSTPTDSNGRYELVYWPEDEETNLTVIVGTRRFTLPEGRAFILPRNSSAEIRIRLPREGSVIDDKPPTLVCTTSRGAMYTGLLAGLDVPPEVPYSVTIPDRHGRFILTVPEDAWLKRPPFFETRLTKFVGREKALKAGDKLPNDFIQPSDRDPRVIPSGF